MPSMRRFAAVLAALALGLGGMLCQPASVSAAISSTGAAMTINDGAPTTPYKLAKVAWTPPYAVPSPAGMAWSLDGSHWVERDDLPNPLSVTLFDRRAGGDPWGRSSIFLRWKDDGGTWSDPIGGWAGFDQVLDSNGWANVLPFSYSVSPAVPVVGQPVTLDAVMPEGYTLPPSAVCEWTVFWGDDQALLHGVRNDSYGWVEVDHAPTATGCGPWTFTLPYTPALQYSYRLDIMQGEGPDNWPQFVAQGDPSLGHALFHASPGATTSRAISHSNFPLVYVLPDSTAPLVVGQPVTYRAYGVGMSVPTDGRWVAEYPDLTGAGDRLGGTVFTFTPGRPVHIHVIWDHTNNAAGHVFSAGYDPVARYPDRWAPVTSAPAASVAAGAATAKVPVRLSWTGSDRGWGIARYQVRESVNGGAWHGVALPTARSRSVVRALATGATYRWEVRALDQAGHWSPWRISATTSLGAVQEASAAVTWSGSWSTVADVGLWHGAARTATAAGASSSYRFYGRSVGWITERGPDRGQGRVYVDGKLAATVDLRADTAGVPVVVFSKSYPASAWHVVRVVVVGTSGRPLVAVDGYVRLR